MAIGIFSGLLARVSYIYVACRTVQAEDSISDEVIHYSIFCLRSHLLQLLDAPRRLPRNPSGNILHAGCSCCIHMHTLILHAKILGEIIAS